MPTILDFQIQPLSAESYSLTVCERGSSQSLATATFSHRVDFLTDFSVDRLNASTKDAAERFDELQKLGAELYQKLFPPAVEQVWREYKQRSEFLTLCLRFAEAATKLEVLPWETLHDGTEFIAAGANTTLTRLPLDVPVPDALPPIPAPLRLFGFFASPLDLLDHERLNAEREQEILLEAINDPAGQGRISAEFEDEAKLPILERSLKDGYHILHFTGHGISPRDGGGLLLEDAHGHKLHASIADVIQAVQAGVATLRLAVISGCQTARTLHSGAFNDLARALLRQRVAAVIAMQFSISDEGGLKFAAVLYQQIAQGVTLERAVHAARCALLADQHFFLNNDALAIVLLAADGACLQTTAAATARHTCRAAAPTANYHGDRLDPLAHGFYGRRREYRKLRDALLHQGQRAVVIHGIGGIGKTALLTHAIQRLRPCFKDVMSFDCRRAALAPETILLELHRYFAAQGLPQLQALIGQNVPPDTLAHAIAKLLAEWPLLIVFDNFESQLDEQRHFINEDLRVFLTALLQATATGSRFLFTTRYLFDLDGERLVNLQELPLGDLSRPEALMLMQKLPNLAQAAYRDKLAVLEKFGGHPYALVTLDRHCSHQPLDQTLQDASSLESELREFLAIELNYQRLSERARELLNRLAAFRSGVPVEAAEWMIRDGFVVSPSGRESKVLSEGGTTNAVRELIDWGLLVPQLEDSGLQLLTVHNLTRDFCHQQQPHELWRERLRTAAAFYTNLALQVPKAQKTQTNVWGEMGAFELLIEAEDYLDAARLLINAHELLDRWGFGLYVERQYARVLNQVGRADYAVLIHNFGVLQQARGNYDVALRYYKQSLKIEKELNNVAAVANSLGQIGGVHYGRGNYDMALNFYKQALKIKKELGDLKGVAGLLPNIGFVHEVRDYDSALDCFEQARKVFAELGDKENVGRLLQGIGNVQQARGHYDAAQDCFEGSLKTFEELGYLADMANACLGLGNLHQNQGNYDVALGYYDRALKIVEGLDDRANVAKSLHSIGVVHQECGNYDEALDYYERSLKIREDIGDLAGKAGLLYYIGVTHQEYGDYDAAVDCYKESIKIAKELGNKEAVAGSEGQIGKLLTENGRYAEAFGWLFNAWWIFVQLRSPNAVTAIANLKSLRVKWDGFDAAWRKVTNEEVPEWLM